MTKQRYEKLLEELKYLNEMLSGSWELSDEDRIKMVEDVSSKQNEILQEMLINMANLEMTR